MTLSRIQAKKARAKSKTAITCIIIGTVLIAGIAAAIVAKSPFVQVSARAESPMKAVSSSTVSKPGVNLPSTRPVAISTNKTVPPVPMLPMKAKQNHTAATNPVPAAKAATTEKAVQQSVQKPASAQHAAVASLPAATASQRPAASSQPALTVNQHPAASPHAATKAEQHPAAALHPAAKLVEKQVSTIIKTPVKTAPQPSSVASQTKEMMGRVVSTGKNSVVLEVNGKQIILVSDGSSLIENQINQLQPDNTIVVHYQMVKNQYLIRNLVVVYTHTLDELDQYIDADYSGMSDSHSVEVYINHKPQVFQLSPSFIGENLDKKFAPGAKVKLALIRTAAGLIVDNISGLE